MSTQFKGLLLKNIQLMGRQKGSLICQIITPIFCLGFIALIKLIVESQITKTGYGLKLSLPIILNVPIYSKLQYAQQMLKVTNCEEWYIYSFDPSINNTFSRDFFGYNDGKEKAGNGILTGVLQSYCDQIQKNSPYFLENTGNTSINEELFKRLEVLNEYDFNKLRNESLISPIPDGAIQIHKITNEEFSYKIQINDHRLPPYHRGNGVSKLLLYNPTINDYSPMANVVNGMLWAVDLFNKAYFNKLFNDVVIISSVQVMPYKAGDNEENIQRIINVAGSTFYPMAISLLMPLFMYNIVLEKENKLIEIMKINGMKMRYYWMSNFLFNYLLYSLTMIIFNIIGAFAMGLTLFTNTDPLLLCLIFVGWGFCQVALAFFFQAFLSNARSATIIGYMLSLWTTLIAVSLNFSIYDLPKRYPNWLLLYPTFNVCRIFYYLTTRCGYESCIDTMYNLEPELQACLIYLFITPWIFMLLGMYFYEVIPQEFGVRKHPFFCVKGICKKRKRTGIKAKLDESYDSKAGHLGLNVASNAVQDDEIKLEQIKVREMGKHERSQYPLITDNLTKIYLPVSKKAKQKKALDGLTICLKNNEIFGLLGPNGAGKTTFFSLLTGIYEPTSGNAWVGGHSIVEKMGQVQEMIGYCPQFDLLWSDLSVEEHLQFYSRLKNVQAKDSQDHVEKTLSNIKLEKYRSFLVRELSGGMKRRLSLGISLVGSPSIVFLDEPTTGLDPENKRQIWEILSNCKEGKCMILTTHLMEEAEVLSDRIGIIVNGSLKCLGTQYKLKKVYGKGFKLVINLLNYSTLLASNELKITEEEFADERTQNNIKFIKDLFPGAGLSECYKNTLIFEISNEEFDAEVLFNEIEKKKQNLFINNWAISQVTLEDIFIRLTENDI